MRRLSVALALALFCNPAVAAERLVAIDVLLEPDVTMVTAAESWNARLQEQTPDGFALDALHRPHITLLQTYIAETDLPAVLAVVDKLAADQDVTALTLSATGIYHIPAGPIGLAGIVVAPSQELLALQDAVITAISPYRKQGGDVAAFVPDVSGAAFDPQLFSYVETFVPDRSGKNYNPHVTTGIAPLDWLTEQETRPFDAFSFHPTGLSIYRLGNFGTAAEQVGHP